MTTTTTEERPVGSVFNARWDRGSCAGCHDPIRAGQKVMKLEDGYAHVMCAPHQQQMSLALEAPTMPAGTTLDDRFTAFHVSNPQVYGQLRRLAFQAKAKGRKTVGIAMLYEVLRWEHTLHTDDPTSEWKLDNSFRSRYARLLMDNEVELEGMFRTRSLTS